MLNNKLKKYIFIKNLDEKIKKNIKKLNNVRIIFNNDEFNEVSFKQCLAIRDFCLKNNISLYINILAYFVVNVKNYFHFFKKINLFSLFCKKHLTFD